LGFPVTGTGLAFAYAPAKNSLLGAIKNQGLLVYPNCIFFIFHERCFTHGDHYAIRVFQVNSEALIKNCPTDDMSAHLVYNAESRYANIVGV
jgi:hypothetical protein